MPCGDVIPNTVFLPACGLETATIQKSSTPPDGSLILPGDTLTWDILVQTSADAPPGIVIEDVFVDCNYVSNVSVPAPWVLQQLTPCNFTITNPGAVHPGVFVCRVTATAGNVLPGEGFGTVINTANLLSPVAVAGNSVTLTFGPLLEGSVGPTRELGEVINYQYQITSGTAPFVVSLFLGDLPTGLSISPTGLLTGTLTAGGDFGFTLQLLDDNGNTYLLSDSCLVATLETIVNGDEENVEALSMTLTAISMI